jgi:hypothetical protein
MGAAAGGEIFFEKIKVFLENLLTCEFRFDIILLDEIQNKY